MSLAPQKSHSWDGSPGLYEFGWGAPPVAGIEPGAKSRAATLSPAFIAMIAVLGSALIIVSYYKFFYKYCKSCPRRRGFESQELEDGGILYQDTDSWQIFQNTYGLDEAVIKSIPLYIFRKGEDQDKFFDGGFECSVCLLEFKEREPLRVLPKCSHAFHVNCIDVWLRSHANCPLCRANIVVNQNNACNVNVGSCPFVPAMAGRVRPNLEHGIAGVVHDSFRSDEQNNNSNSDGGRHSTQGFTAHVQSPNVLLDYEVAADAAEEMLVDNFEDLGENSDSNKPVLTRSYSFGCSGSNEDYSRNAEASFDSVLLTENVASASSPWKRAFKKFNSKGAGLFSLRSPFFNRTRGGSASSSSAVNNFSSMFVSPARDYSHRSYRRDFRHGGGRISRIRGGSLSPPILRVEQQSGRAQSMTSPLFVKRSSFSVFEPSRLRSGDPEALLSPDRFSNQPE